MKLQAWLDEKKMSRLDLANKLGISRRTIDDWCCGGSIPREDKMKIIHHFTNQMVWPGDFYDLSEASIEPKDLIPSDPRKATK